jgi:predicted component of viral defense system (DUF524 family)
MTRFACQRVILQINRSDTQLVLSLYDASWRQLASTQETVGPYQVWGRALAPDEPYTGVIASAAPPYVSLSEKGEYQLVAKFNQAPPSPSFWRDDPASLLDASGHSARLQVHGITGMLRVKIKVANRTFALMPLRVLPYKLDYQTDVMLLLRELALVATSLVLRAKPVAVLSVVSRAYQPSPLEMLIILQALLRPSWVPRAINLIAKSPHHEIQNQLKLLPSHQLKNALPEQLVQALVREGNFASNKKLLPRRLRVQQRTLTFDTAENRFVVAFWERLQRERRRLVLAFRRAPEMSSHVSSLSRQISRLPSPIPAEAITKAKPTTPSLFLRRSPGYRELWLASRLLGKDLTSTETARLEAPGRTLPILYESWCLLVLARCLSSMVGVRPKVPYPLFLQTDGVLRFKTGTMQPIAPGIALGYQMQFQTLRASSLQLRPDFLVEIFGKRLVFDAKYRLSDDALSPQHEDMMVAHAYKDALQVDGSFVLYPGKGEAQIHRQAPPSELPAVGAFPLRPTLVQKESLLTPKKSAERISASPARASATLKGITPYRSSSEDTLPPRAHGEETLLLFLQSCLWSHSAQVRKAAEQRAIYDIGESNE